MTLPTPEWCELENTPKKVEQLRSCHACGRVVCLQCCVPIPGRRVEEALLHPRARQYVGHGRPLAQLVWRPRIVGYGIHVD